MSQCLLAPCSTVRCPALPACLLVHPCWCYFMVLRTGAVLSHSNLIAGAAALAEQLEGWLPGDRHIRCVCAWGREGGGL